MATPALIVVITVAVLTVVVLAGTILSLLQQVKTLTKTLNTMRSDLEPALEKLQADTAIAQAELERINEAASELSAREG